MTLWMTIRRDGIERRFDIEDAPISIGGQDAVLPLFDEDGQPSATRAGLIGALGGRPFVQKEHTNPALDAEAADALPLFLDEEIVEASSWLEGSGQIRVGPLRLAYEPRGKEWFLRVENLAAKDDPVGRQPIESIPHVVASSAADRSAGTARADGETRRPRIQWALAALGFLLLALGVLLALFRSVSLEFEPRAERIELRDGPSARIGGRFWLRPGTYRVHAERDGYEPFDASIEVESHQNFAFEFVPLPGLLSIETQPVSGATVWIDDKEVGKTPIEAWSLPQGPHAIRALAELHRETEQAIEIEGLGRSQRLVLSLEPAWAELEVLSEPPGALLWLDDRPIGPTPIRVKASEGERRVALRLEGFQEWTDVQNVEATRDRRIGPIELARVRARPTRKVEPPAPTEVVEPTKTTHPPRLQTTNGGTLLLIEGGPVRMGSPRGQQGRRTNEREREASLVRPFYLATRETTNAEFQAFRKNHDSGYLKSIPLRHPEQPVVRVTWQDAAAYCNWLSKKENLPLAYRKKGKTYEAVVPLNTGYRLPTEAEWTFAAKAGSSDRYPWGGSFPPPAGAGNFGDRSAAGFLPAHLESLDDGRAESAPVASHEANPLGFFDLAGNVAEWMHDVYSPDGAEGIDPTGPSAGSQHVIRGSSYRDSSITKLRTAYRDGSAEARDDLGFRIARYAE